MKKIFSLLLCVLMLASALLLASCKDNSEGSEKPEEEKGSQGLEYKLITGVVSYYAVTGMGTCTDTVVVIPKTYNGVPVNAIAAGAFSTKPAPITPEEDKKADKDQKLSATIETIVPSADFSIVQTNRQEMKITEVVIPSSVTEIGDEAFYGCASLSTVSASNLINLIGTDAFKETAFYLDESNWQNDVLYLDNYLVEVRDGFSGVLNVKEGTVNIAANAAKENTGITGIAIPSSLRVIGRNAFFGCTGLKTLDLSVSGISIGTSAFQNCSSLTEVKIGSNESPKYIAHTGGQGGAYLPSGSTGLGFGSFIEQMMNKTDDVFMKQGVVLAFYGVAPVDPASVYAASVGSSAFCGCTSLSSVTFGKNVGIIGSGAFEGCISLTSVDLSPITAHTTDAPVYIVGATYYRHMDLARVFTDCTSLKSVKLPKDIQYLNSTFQGCTSLESFIVPDTVKGLNHTFSDCTALKNVALPKGLAALSGAFRGCTALASIQIPETVVKIGANTFSYCESLRNVYVPDAVTEIGDYAFCAMPAIANISIGNGVKTIGEYALDRLVSITFRGTVADWESVDKHEFWGGTTAAGEQMMIHCTNGSVASGVENNSGNNPSSIMSEMHGISRYGGKHLYILYRGVTVLVEGNEVSVSPISFEDLVNDLKNNPDEEYEDLKNKLYFLSNSIIEKIVAVAEGRVQSL